MNDRMLCPVKVWELYRNALAVKRTDEETARDSLFGLPGDLIPQGWNRVKDDLTHRFSRSAKTIDEILGILREWEESAIRIIKEHLEIHPVLDLSQWAYDENASPIRYELVSKGTPFPTLSAEDAKFYETYIKQKTGLTDDCSDWRRYWLEDCGIESDQTRSHVFRNLELSEAMGLLGLSHAKADVHPPAMPTCALNRVPAKMLRAIWKLVDWSSEKWRADIVAIAMEVWADGEKAENSTFRYTLNKLQDELIESGDRDWLFDLKSPWVYVSRIR
ncbi:hypothetical protein SH449x_001709 [Pirellulaceae bacterium SH449]